MVERTLRPADDAYNDRMCGRLDQSDIDRLIRNFAWAADAFNRSHAEGKYNVCPGTFRPVMHVEDGELFIDDLHWGYKSKWSDSSGSVPMAVNTRLENINNRYWKPLLKKGRAIVPASGWFEWTGPKGAKQPWHIHRKDRAPLYLAALASFKPDADIKTQHAFTIVTADKDGGLLDGSDRRPLVLSAEDAALWLDPDLPADQAVMLVGSVALEADSFAWHPVDPLVANVKRQGCAVVEPIVLPQACPPASARSDTGKTIEIA